MTVPGQQRPAQDKEYAAQTTSAAPSKAEFSYSKILTRLCCALGFCFFLKPGNPVSVIESVSSIMFPKKSFSALDSWILLFKNKNADWYSYRLVCLPHKYH